MNLYSKLLKCISERRASIDLTEAHFFYLDIYSTTDLTEGLYACHKDGMITIIQVGNDDPK